jgi:hypothetical protein
MIELAVKAKLNLDVRIDFKLMEPAARPAKDAENYNDYASQEDGSPSGKTPARDTDPIVNAAIEMFGGEISDDQRSGRKTK